MAQHKTCTVCGAEVPFPLWFLLRSPNPLLGIPARPIRCATCAAKAKLREMLP